MLSNPNVLNVSRANSIPFYIGSNSGGIEWEGKDTEDDIIVGFTFADQDYIETMGMRMADGRFFSKDIQATIDHNLKTVNIVVPEGTDLTSLVPSFKLKPALLI